MEIVEDSQVGCFILFSLAIFMGIMYSILSAWIGSGFILKYEDKLGSTSL